MQKMACRRRHECQQELKVIRTPLGIIRVKLASAKTHIRSELSCG